MAKLASDDILMGIVSLTVNNVSRHIPEDER